MSPDPMPARVLDVVAVNAVHLPTGTVITLYPDDADPEDTPYLYVTVAEIVTGTVHPRTGFPTAIRLEARCDGTWMLWLRGPIPNETHPPLVRLIPVNGSHRCQPVTFANAVNLSLTVLADLHHYLPLTDPQATEADLLAAVFSTDRLAALIALAHPTCPDSVQVACHLAPAQGLPHRPNQFPRAIFEYCTGLPPTGLPRH